MGQLFGERTTARAQALQLLFQAEARHRSVASLLEVGDYVVDPGPLAPFAEELAAGTDQMSYALDRVLNHHAHEWSVSRMASVDRNILRLALFEILEVDEVDTSVSINEALELARAYASDEFKSISFINGILGSISDDISAGKDLFEEARRSNASNQIDASDTQEDA